MVALLAALAFAAPPDAAKPPGIEAKLHGTWAGGPCRGSLTFNPDGTYARKHYSPGNNTVSGAWFIKWDALPPMLVLTCEASDDKDRVGKTTEVKLLRLDGEALEYQFPNESKSVYTRRKPGEKEPDAKAAPKAPKVLARTTRILNGGSAVIRSDIDLGRHNLTNGTAQQVKDQLAKDLLVREIDWDRQMVICISNGKQQKGGMSVGLTSLEVTGGKLLVRWKYNEDGGDAERFHPELVLLLDRFDGDVVFDPAPRTGK